MHETTHLKQAQAIVSKMAQGVGMYFGVVPISFVWFWRVPSPHALVFCWENVFQLVLVSSYYALHSCRSL